MKIAVVTDDGQSISAHFGRAQYFLVFNIVEGRIIAHELRPKANHTQFAQFEEAGHSHHEHGLGPQAAGRHKLMMDPIGDCQVLMARGMGQGAHNGLRNRGIEPILTDMVQAEEAVSAYLEGKLENHPERLH